MNPEPLFRLLTAGLLVSAFAFSVYFRHRAERQGGRKTSKEGQSLLIVLRLIGLLTLLPLLGYLINPAWVAPLRLAVPEPLRWGAAAVAALLIPALYWLFSTIGNNISPTQTTRQGHQLITTGPYRYIRHPLYTFGGLFFLALALLSGIWWLALGLVAGLGLLIWRTPREEAHLIATFGEEYRQYMARTGRYFPRLLSHRA
jgi:protein-S-isoprenylcysteine O-methyltransferase Ste14